MVKLANEMKELKSNHLSPNDRMRPSRGILVNGSKSQSFNSVRSHNSSSGQHMGSFMESDQTRGHGTEANREDNMSLSGWR